MRFENCLGDEDNSTIECKDIDEAKNELRKAFLLEIYEKFITQNYDTSKFIVCGKIEYDKYGAYIEYNEDENVRWAITDEEGFVLE